MLLSSKTTVIATLLALSLSAPATHAQTYTFTTLDVPLPSESLFSLTYPSSVNNAGQVVGYYTEFHVAYPISGTYNHGFTESGGNFTTLDDPLGPGRPMPSASTMLARWSATTALPSPKASLKLVAPSRL